MSNLCGEICIGVNLSRFDDRAQFKELGMSMKLAVVVILVYVLVAVLVVLPRLLLFLLLFLLVSHLYREIWIEVNSSRIYEKNCSTSSELCIRNRKTAARTLLFLTGALSGARWPPRRSGALSGSFFYAKETK